MNATKKQAGMAGGLLGLIRRRTRARMGMLFLIAAGLPPAWAASPVTVTLSAPPNGSTYTAPATITVTATVTAAQGYKVSKVEFFHGSTLIGTDTKSPYSLTWSNVQPGNYMLTAVATAVKKKQPNQTATSASVTITVSAPNAPPTVSMTSPANGATFTAPANITLSATATDSDGTLQKVEFFHGGTNLITTLTTPPYSIVWTGVPQGAYTLTAVATDNLNAATTSSPLNVTVGAAAAQLYFIHTDHLNTPRLITNNAGQAVWRWDNTDPFGGNPPDENPSGLGTFTCNLRLPGQYFDKETNLHYNYFRDYDPAIGRFVQSDPIGLMGGVNTYAYVLNNPLWYADPSGLDVNVCFYGDAAMGFGHVGFGLPGETGTQGFYPTANPLSSPGTVKADTQKEQQCKVIESPPDKDQCMQQCRQRQQANPGQYVLTSRQCTSFVRDCLKECGLPAGTYSGPRPNPFFKSLPGKRQ